MATKITELAEKLGLTSKDLRKKLDELGFGVKSTARVIEDDVAALVTKELTTTPLAKVEEVAEVVESQKEEEEVPATPAGTVEIYESAIEREIDREILKSQRKKMAGKDSGHKDSSSGSRPGPVQGVIEIPDSISVKEFAEKTGLGAARIIGVLMKNGVLANINQQIDFDTAAIIASDLGIELKRKRTGAALSDLYEGNVSAILKEDDASVLKPRPPVVVIMGHVDHGKTKLLDYIRSSHVIDSESGGITQHIGAYQVEKNGRKITFLDTPGHEAFTAMRARGAKLTDIAILVVAADEGVKPQTIEALNHAKEAGVPIIVALNKMDKPGAQPDRVKGELAEHGLQPEEWGGTTVMVPISALTGLGIDQLLEMILLTADMLNLKANPDREGVATVVEAHLDKSLGPVATVVVNAGTLHLMDNVVIGTTHGRLKTMKDHLGRNMKEAPPSTPVFLAGLSSTPQSGDILHVVADEKIARMKALQIGAMKAEAAKEQAMGLDQILIKINEGKLKLLKFVLKADTQGSLEAIKYALSQVKDDNVSFKIIHAGVGNITEGDVIMAAASGGLVIGFHVTIQPQVQRTAEKEGVKVALYDIIYKLLEDLKNILSGLLEPEIIEIILGRTEVKQIFLTKKKEQIIGCRVLSGKVENKSKIRIMRNDVKVGDGEVATLRFIDKVVAEIAEGNECGILYRGDVVVQPGDILECYKIEKKKRTLA
ncbi:MAG: translation initiation factor IF-2 [Candidatus Peregrinibacteria bacterium]|nr:translation initiation factor IF-2 [Candidatus Peregrinibacteria bacterium]